MHIIFSRSRSGHGGQRGGAGRGLGVQPAVDVDRRRCVPTDETITAGIYAARGFEVGFLSGATGEIRLRCPVTVIANGSTPSFEGIDISYHSGATGVVRGSGATSAR